MVSLGALGLAAGIPFGILGRNTPVGATFLYTIAALFFGGILLLFLIGGTGRFQHWVNVRPLRFFGYISYGLYLLHMIVFRAYDSLGRRFWPAHQPTSEHFGLVLIRFVIAGGAAVALAYVSRVYFEENFLRLKDRWTRKGVQIEPESAPMMVVAVTSDASSYGST